jgi:1,4-dihydroxy-2-naphthoate octaprenyltransferase
MICLISFILSIAVSVFLFGFLYESDCYPLGSTPLVDVTSSHVKGFASYLISGSCLTQHSRIVEKKTSRKETKLEVKASLYMSLLVCSSFIFNFS